MPGSPSMHLSAPEALAASAVQYPKDKENI